jgi:two-component system response regulator RpfG
MVAILVIDDEMISRQILCQLAKSIDVTHDVRGFDCPRGALDWTKNHPVSLVLTDYKMPEMNGIEFIRMFRTQPACVHVPVIMVTAVEDPEMRIEALGAGATEFMLKPVNHQECRKLCRKLLIQNQH